ncbi:hypothetical protein [Actinomadura nitritigenes]|uniref:Integrase n=1 Tax=Actinomadura nitritigenes TaxID=134602 RepID=A0ABS3RBI9_9ACTN|nr:hypothetical protein [Actinomadura nitritigenes]MBO2443571.1 hypothetical protein [Actinomadura nitritigenes]
MTDRDKNAEILVLRHQIAVLERRLAGKRMRFTAADRALLAALLHRLPLVALRRMRLLVRPDTVLRWHRDLVAGQHAARSKPNRPGRPPTVRSIRTLVLRLVRENPGRGYRRVHGELLVLGVKLAASTVGEILKDAGVDPAPERSTTTWAGFLRSQAKVLLACDFLETVTLTGARMYVLAVIEHHTRRDQRHLLHALREFETFYNQHRPHQSIANARPLKPLPPPITEPDQIAHLNIRRRQRLGGILNEYEHAA